MDRSRTLLALAGMTLMTAVVGAAGMTGARAEDFQAQGSHLNDPANARNLNDQQDPKASRLNGGPPPPPPPPPPSAGSQDVTPQRSARPQGVPPQRHARPKGVAPQQLR